MAIPTEIREIVRRRYHFCCGYCGVHENDVGSELEIDHFKPVALGGTDELDNLVYCCPACNKFKRDFWPSDDATINPRRLLHPMKDNLAEYLVENEEGRSVALSETGAFHIARLRLNRLQLLAFRKKRQVRRKIYSTINEAIEKRRRLEIEETELTDLLAEALSHLNRLQNE